MLPPPPVRLACRQSSLRRYRRIWMALTQGVPSTVIVGRLRRRTRPGSPRPTPSRCPSSCRTSCHCRCPVSGRVYVEGVEVNKYVPQPETVATYGVLNQAVYGFS